LGCDIPQRPKIIVISKSPVTRPSDPKEVTTIEQAIAAIITVCRDDLGLPVVDPLYVYLYKNAASLAFYGRGWKTFAFDVANVAAFADGDKIHVNLSKVGEKDWSQIFLVLAHEYTHNVQLKLSSGTVRTATWITEGLPIGLPPK
jgi:hypothetical protein